MIITCPRCQRIGIVTLDTKPDAIPYARYQVAWQPRTAGAIYARRDDVDHDACITENDLASPLFGCGYDNEVILAPGSVYAQ